MKFGYTIVYVPSVTDAMTFYKQAFGFQVRFLHESGQYGELESGSTTLAFASYAMGEMNFGAEFVPVSASATLLSIDLAFNTDDVPSAYAKAVAAGALPLHVLVRKPWGQVVAYVRSLEGTLIELCPPIVG